MPRPLRPLRLLAVVLALVACDDVGTCTDCLPETDAGPGGRDAGGEADAGDVGAERCGAACDAVVVDATWLAARLDVSDLTVLDARGRSAYEAGHVPGARWIDGNALRATVDGVGGQVAPTADLEAAFRAAGLRRGDAVLVMGADTGTGPARVFWTLEYAGHPRVLFLDGGWSAWQASGGAVEEGASDPSASDPSDYAIDALDADRRVEADWVRDNLGEADVLLVDARTASEFGAGHILDALHVDWTENVERGALRPEGDVRALYPALDGAAAVGVAYCQTGSRAAVAYLTLRWLGVDARLYDGSWAEWSTLDAGEYPRGP